MNATPTYEELAARVRELEAMLEDEGRVVQWEILTFLAEAWDRDGPPGIVENRDLASRLHLGMGMASRALKVLATLGLTDHDPLGFASCLTPEGYEIARSNDRKTPLTDQIVTLRKGYHGLK